MTVLLRDPSVRAPHWAFSPPPGTGLACPLPRRRALPEFSTTSSVLNMKPISARGLRNTLSAEKLAGCVVSGQNQTQSQCISTMWFPPVVSGGRSCGFYGIRDQFRSPTGAVFSEPRKTGAGKHTCLYTPGVMHMSTGLSSLHTFSVYVRSLRIAL